MKYSDLSEASVKLPGGAALHSVSYGLLERIPEFENNRDTEARLKTKRTDHIKGQWDVNHHNLFIAGKFPNGDLKLLDGHTRKKAVELELLGPKPDNVLLRIIPVKDDNHFAQTFAKINNGAGRMTPVEIKDTASSIVDFTPTTDLSKAITPGQMNKVYKTPDFVAQMSELKPTLELIDSLEIDDYIKPTTTNARKHGVRAARKYLSEIVGQLLLSIYVRGEKALPFWQAYIKESDPRIVEIIDSISDLNKYPSYDMIRGDEKLKAQIQDLILEFSKKS